MPVVRPLVVALLITAAVYGAVSVLIKMDDVGLALTQKDSAGMQKLGRGLVAAMPKILTAIGIIGTMAMLWVGGHILLSGLDTLGVHAPEELVHHLSEPARGVPGVGGALAWLVDTACSLVFGLAVGAIPLAVVQLIRSRRAAH